MYSSGTTVEFQSPVAAGRAPIWPGCQTQWPGFRRDEEQYEIIVDGEKKAEKIVTRLKYTRILHHEAACLRPIIIL